MTKDEANSNQHSELHYYRITVVGYGGETAYLKVSKQAYEFWFPLIESGDTDAIEYCLNAAENEFEFEEITEVPIDAQFLLNKDEGYSASWDDAPNEFEHIRGAAVDHAWVTIQRVDSNDFSANHVENVIESESLTDINSRIGDETDWEVDLFEGPEEGLITYADDGDYVFQFTSSEKGTFFDGIVETRHLFETSKLRFVVGEAPSGEDTLFSVKYDSKEVDNNEGDTRGQGYSAHIWQHL
jgi:hypothetical protein